MEVKARVAVPLDRSDAKAVAIERALVVIAVGERLDADEAISLAAVIFGVPSYMLRGTSRLKSYAAARHYAMYLLRVGGWSFPEIGSALKRDHTSVMSGVRKVAMHEDFAALRPRGERGPVGGRKVRIVVDPAPTTSGFLGGEEEPR